MSKELFKELEESPPIRAPESPCQPARIAPLGSCGWMSEAGRQAGSPRFRYTALRDRRRCQGTPITLIFTCHSNQGEVKSQLVLPVPGTPSTPIRLSISSVPLLDCLRETSLLLLSGNSSLCRSGQWRDDWLYLFLIKPYYPGIGYLEQKRYQGSYRGAPTLEKFFFS